MFLVSTFVHRYIITQWCFLYHQEPQMEAGNICFLKESNNQKVFSIWLAPPDFPTASTFLQLKQNSSLPCGAVAALLPISHCKVLGLPPPPSCIMPQSRSIRQESHLYSSLGCAISTISPNLIWRNTLGFTTSSSSEKESWKRTLVDVCSLEQLS